MNRKGLYPAWALTTYPIGLLRPDLSQLLPESRRVKGALVGGFDGFAWLVGRERFAVGWLFHIPWKVKAAPQFPKERLR